MEYYDLNSVESAVKL